jgi:hypothetical protein
VVNSVPDLRAGLPTARDLQFHLARAGQDRLAALAIAMVPRLSPSASDRSDPGAVPVAVAERIHEQAAELEQGGRRTCEDPVRLTRPDDGSPSPVMEICRYCAPAFTNVSAALRSWEL